MATKLWRASAIEVAKADLQDVLAEVRTQAEPKTDDELQALAKVACSPSSTIEKPEEWAHRLASELVKK